MWRYMGLIACIAALTAVAAPVQADDVIKVHISVKVIVSPSTGNPPMGISPARIQAATLPTLDFLSAPHWRGYRFDVVDPVTEVGGPSDPNGPSQWYDSDVAYCLAIMDAALADPVAYAWNANAINIYINNYPAPKGIHCTQQGESIIVIGRQFGEAAAVYLHEIGHHFTLCHTQGCQCAACDTNQTGVCHTEPGDDGIADTLRDLQCWNRDQIATFNFGSNYSGLPSNQQEQVEDVFLNIMAYHDRVTASRLTELQLDRWADGANGPGSRVVDGRTVFVAGNGSSNGDGSSTNPLDRVANGVAAANAAGGDIVLLRPGSYGETLTIDKPVTLRATRSGSAVIGQ